MALTLPCSSSRSKFLVQIELSGDPFLTSFSVYQRHQLLSAFAQAVRDCSFSKSSLGNDNLVAGTCLAAINNVAAAFEASGHPNPTLDALGRKSFLLHRLFRGFKNLDGSTRHQKCISVDEILRMCTRVTSCPLMLAFQQNYLLGFFFAMRSCENFKVAGPRRTCPLRLGNIIFWKQNVIDTHSSPVLETADRNNGVSTEDLITNKIDTILKNSLIELDLDFLDPSGVSHQSLMREL